MVKTDADPREYLNVKETALLLRVSASSVYRAVEAGTIPAFRLSERGSIRVPRSAVEPEPRP